jgi:hypothetical protein
MSNLFPPRGHEKPLRVRMCVCVCVIERERDDIPQSSGFSKL